MNLDRLIKLVGSLNVEKIKEKNILIVGLGGVGGYAFLSLVRSGIENFTIIDKDVIDITNLNRQIITNTTNIGKLKTIEAEKCAKLINNNVKIKKMNIFLDEENIEKMDFNYDYVIDACDTINTKKALIMKCLEKNVKIISSMGTAKKMDATKLEITSLNKTKYDSLARILRRKIPKNLQKKVVVISSIEEAKKIKELGSNSFVPAVAGLYITDYIINDIVKM